MHMAQMFFDMADSSLWYHKNVTGSLTADMVNDAHNLAHFYVNSNKLSGNLDDFAEANLGNMKKLRLE